MQPTKYRGDAVIEGERVEAELHLNSDSVSLALGPGHEVLQWPITSLEVAATTRGTYELCHGDERFTFEPSIDDGLDDEISLRRRFVGITASPAKPAAPEPEAPAQPQPTPQAMESSSIADRVSAAGRQRDGGPTTRSLSPRTLALGLAGLVGVVALALVVVLLTKPDSSSGASLAQSEAAQEGGEPAGTIAPEVAGITVMTEPEPAPTPTSPPTTPETTVAPATTTPPTTAPPENTPEDDVGSAAATGSVFEIPPADLIDRWDALALPHSSTLVASDVQIGDGRFAYSAGPFVRVQGSTSGGAVRQITFYGDPSGTVADDRAVLTALGLTVGMVEPRLPPQGRRELVSALGLDISQPDLSGLGDSLDYLDNRYSLSWDAEAMRIVFDIRPVSEASTDDGDS